MLLKTSFNCILGIRFDLIIIYKEKITKSFKIINQIYRLVFKCFYITSSLPSDIFDNTDGQKSFRSDFPPSCAVPDYMVEKEFYHIVAEYNVYTFQRQHSFAQMQNFH